MQTKNQWKFYLISQYKPRGIPSDFGFRMPSDSEWLTLFRVAKEVTLLLSLSREDPSTPTITKKDVDKHFILFLRTAV